MSVATNAVVEDWHPAEDRFDRQRRIVGWNQERLARAHVLVAGAGAIGNEALKTLALLGVGRATVIDLDRIETTNLARMVLFRESDVGRPKAEVAAERARELAPAMRIDAISGDIEHDLGLGLVREVDVILGCVDNLGARVALNRAARRAGVPWVNAAIDARAIEVASFLVDGPCYECGVGARAWDRLEKRFSCGTGLLAAAAVGKVATVATLAAIAAAVQVEAALALLRRPDEALPAGEADPLFALRPGERLHFSLETLTSRRTRIEVAAGCLGHERWPAATPLLLGPEASLDEVAVRAEASLGERFVAVDLGFDLVTGFSCDACGAHEPRIAPRGRLRHVEAICGSCRQTRRVSHVSLVERDGALARCPLAALGVAPRAVLRLRNAAGGERFVELEGAR